MYSNVTFDNPPPYPLWEVDLEWVIGIPAFDWTDCQSCSNCENPTGYTEYWDYYDTVYAGFWVSYS
jgi:hypothetical protein